MSDDLRTVEAGRWRTEVAAAKDAGYDYFDWLGTVDQIGRSDDFEILVRLVDLAADAERAVLLRSRIPRDDPRLDSVADIFAGAGWHERESAELFAITFTGGDRRRLLLPDDYVGAPLRKDAVLAARAGIEWPGAKEPGGDVRAPSQSGGSPSQSGALSSSKGGVLSSSKGGVLSSSKGGVLSSSKGAPSRRRMVPPGVPEPEVWGDRDPNAAEPDPAEVSESAVGGRVRRRRR
jgi:NADH-quinone oxidoreductase subunit C